MNAAFGAVIVCVAFATTIEVMMATTVAMRMTPGRENFWIRILIAFILFGVSLWGFPMCGEDCSCIVFNGRDCLTSVLQVQASFVFRVCESEPVKTAADVLRAFVGEITYGVFTISEPLALISAQLRRSSR